MHKIWENWPEALRFGEPGENTRYAPPLRGGGGGGGGVKTPIEDAET